MKSGVVLILASCTYTGVHVSMCMKRIVYTCVSSTWRIVYALRYVYMCVYVYVYMYTYTYVCIIYIICAFVYPHTHTNTYAHKFKKIY